MALKTESIIDTKYIQQERKEKNLWCREIYWKIIQDELGFCPFKETPGCHLRICRRNVSECRGAHSLDEIVPFKHVISFEQLNKATFNWVNLYNQLLTVLKNDSIKIKSDEHIVKLSNISSLDFFQAISLWRELACFYRKISKEIPSRKVAPKNTPVSSYGFTYSEEVPGFYLPSSVEEIAWSVSRSCRDCPLHFNFTKSIESNEKTTLWDLCLATGTNCKEGVHDMCNRICEEDFLTGKCSCDTIEQFTIKKRDLQIKINLLKEKEIKSDEDFMVVKPKKFNHKNKFNPYNQITKEINSLQIEMNKLMKSRKIHYTEFGMIPFEIQYKKYIDSITPTKQEEIKLWTHDINDKSKESIKPVVKVVKFGTKK